MRNGPEIRERVNALEREALARAEWGVLTLGGPEDEPRETPGSRRRLGRSMVPLLQPGDAVFWRRPVSPPRFAETIVFQQAARIDDAESEGATRSVAGALSARDLVVHRVVGTRPDGRLRTKGDGRVSADDSPVSPAHVVGIVEAVRVGGSWRSLSGAGARAWALLAGAISALGNAAFVVGSAVDGALGGAAVFRVVAGRGQRLAQRIWHRVAFEAAHPSVADPAAAERGEEEAES